MLNKIMASYGFFSVEGNENLYLSPFTGENTPSLHVGYDKEHKKWKCFSSAKAGNDIQLVIELEELQGRKLSDEVIKKKDGSEFTLKASHKAYNIIQERINGNTAYVAPVQREATTEPIKKGNEVINIQPVYQIALKNLLVSRGIPESLFSFINEVTYLNHKSNRKFFGVCLQNNSGGVAHRNKLEFGKGNIGKADITTSLRDENKEIKVFEGMFDFWSYLTIAKITDPFNLLFDVCVLNSTTHARRVEKLIQSGKYDLVSSYMDNGTSGDFATIELRDFATDKNVKFIDKRKTYKTFDDLNDLLTGKKIVKRQIRVVKVDECFNIYYQGQLIGLSVKNRKEVDIAVKEIKTQLKSKAISNMKNLKAYAKRLF